MSEELKNDPGIAKALKALDRFEECASDGEDVDLSRAAFAALEWLGWIERISARRRWQMTPEGEAMLASAPTPPASSAGEVEGWRPIETAPRDGTWLLLWLPYAGGYGQCHIAPGRWAKDHYRKTFSWFINGNGMRRPTHWRPLPAPPVAALASDAGREGV